MSDKPAHSPGPFGLYETETGYLITDSFGDSCAALARRTGDHPPEEQLANALLFRASPDMLRALKFVEKLKPKRRGHNLDRAIIWDMVTATISRAETGE